MRYLKIVARVAAMAVCAGLVVSQPLTSSAATTPPITPGHTSYPAAGTTVQGLGIDAANQNAQLAESVPATIKASWHAQAPLCPQAGESVATSISVSGAYTAVVEQQYQCSFLSVYTTSTGALRWRKQWTSRSALTANIVGDVVYLEADNPTNGETDLYAYTLATGALKWQSFDGDYYAQYTTSIGSGIATSQQWADDLTTGKHKFTFNLSPTSSTGGVSFVAGGRLFYNASGAVEAHSVTTGALLWAHPKSDDNTGPGAGNALPALHNGLLYIRSIYGNSSNSTLVLDPATGKLVRTLPVADEPIAFDGSVGVFTRTPYGKQSTLTAVNLTTGHVYWTHVLPGASAGNPNNYTVVDTAPVIENGLVWILDTTGSDIPGHVASLDEVTGATRSITVQPCGAGSEPGMLAVAEHRVFASSGCGVLSYVAK